jgi:hypothetical protein
MKHIGFKHQRESKQNSDKLHYDKSTTTFLADEKNPIHIKHHTVNTHKLCDDDYWM